MALRALAIIFLALAGLTAQSAAAQSGPDGGPSGLASRDHPVPQATDFNLITAVDVSDSITRNDEFLQYSGLARGVVNPAFLGRIAEGSEQRIGLPPSPGRAAAPSTSSCPGR